MNTPTNKSFYPQTTTPPDVAVNDAVDWRSNSPEVSKSCSYNRANLSGTQPSKQSPAAADTSPGSAKAAPDSSKSQGNTPAGRNFATRAEMDACVVSELVLPAALSAIIGEKIVGKSGVKVAFDAFITSAGAPTDPIERALLEQYLLAHHRLANLQVQAELAKSLEAIKVYNAAAVRLMGEMRRFAPSIRDYRQPRSSKNVAFIQQQNVAAAGGQQQVTYGAKGQAKETPPSGVDTPSPKASENLHELRERIVRGEAKPAAATASK